MGIAVFDREHDRSVDDLIARADALMYQEKYAKRQRSDGDIVQRGLPAGDVTPSSVGPGHVPLTPPAGVDAPASI
jgi:hypothetical protein